ncbi:hypothetical protein BJV82DRAFT_505083, partial [Fennellomyces sp. T-0311]
ILCIAHRLRIIVNYDRIIVIDQGKMTEFDTPYALMAGEDSLLYQMCEHSDEFTELLAITYS